MKSNRWIKISTIVVVSVVVLLGVFAPDVLASEHGGNGGNPLNPLESLRGDLALWTTVTFLIVLGILWKFAWGPIVQGLDKREKYVADQRSEAEKANDDARALLDEYKQQLSQAKAEIQQMRADAQAGAERAANLLMNKAKNDIMAEKKAATQEIASATVQAQKELAVTSAAMAVELAGTILKQKLDPKAHRQLIDDAVAKFGK